MTADRPPGRAPWARSRAHEAAAAAATETLLNCYMREGGAWHALPGPRRARGRPAGGDRRRRAPVARRAHQADRRVWRASRRPSATASGCRSRSWSTAASPSRPASRPLAALLVVELAGRPGAGGAPDPCALLGADLGEHRRRRRLPRDARRRDRRAVERAAAELHRERAGAAAGPHAASDAEEPQRDERRAASGLRAGDRGALPAALARRRCRARRARQRDRHAGAGARRAPAARRPGRRRRRARRCARRARRADPAPRPPMGARPPAEQRRRRRRAAAGRRARRPRPARQPGRRDDLGSHRLQPRLALAAEVLAARPRHELAARDAAQGAAPRCRGRAPAADRARRSRRGDRARPRDAAGPGLPRRAPRRRADRRPLRAAARQPLARPARRPTSAR